MKELKDTITLMNSKDYKERFVAEYWQLKIRYEKLKDFNTKIELGENLQFFEHHLKVSKVNNELTNDDSICSTNYKVPQHDCSLDLLKSQQRTMGDLLHILELRALIERIDLKQDIKSNDTIFEKKK